MPKKKSNPLLYLGAAMWRHSDGRRKNVTLFGVMFLVAESLNLLGQPLIIATLMNTIQTSGIAASTMPTLIYLLIGTVVLDILFWVFHGPARVLEEMNAFRVRASYRRHLLSGIMALPLSWHNEHHSGDTIDKIEKGAGGIYEFSHQSFMVIYGVVRLLGSYAVLTYFSPPAGIIVACMIAITICITMQFDRILVPQLEEINRAENKVAESIFDAISNIATVLILRAEKLVFSAIMHKVESPYDLVKRKTILTEVKWALTTLCCTVMTAVVLGVYFWQNQNAPQGILIGSVYLLVQYLTKMSDLFYQFTTMYGEIQVQRARVTNAELISNDFIAEDAHTHVLPKDWQELRIENLNFSYGDESRGQQLQHISLVIARGERIAFVGKTGSGKTTLLKIMRDLHQPQSLALSVDGVEIPHGFGGIENAIALVPQDPEIFATTILGNITIGAEYDDATVRWATDIACFTDVAHELPAGLQSSIKERGVNLSGGQKQRLALARGVLASRGKSLVLLDEPTSSLDVKTEQDVYRNIFENFGDTTVISSIHRLHLLPLFDRIIMFESGRIVGTGSVQELLVSCPEFMALWKTAEEKEGGH